MPKKTKTETKSWRELSLSNTDDETAPTLRLIAGKWAITILDEGRAYEFERGGETKHGVAFLVNAKHLDSGGNFPNHSWGVTAKTLLARLAETDNTIGCVIMFLASGDGLSRRYSEISVKEPQQKL